MDNLSGKEFKEAVLRKLNEPQQNQEKLFNYAMETSRRKRKQFKNSDKKANGTHH